MYTIRCQTAKQKCFPFVSFLSHIDWELESIKSLFNEKEKELAMAVAKVEEMTRQLEDIRSGKVKSATNNQSPAAMAELEKLKKELVVSLVL